MNETFLDTLADFLVSHIDPLDSAERVTAYDRVIETLESERATARELALENARWECEGGAIPPETPDIVLLGSYS